MSNKLTLGERVLNDIEKWKPVLIDNKETNYVVSKDGFVFNKNTRTLLSGSKDSRGYHVVSIWFNGKMYSKKVHRLVAEAYIPNPENKPTVNHKDGNKDHNYVENLEWATHQENIDHAIMTGLRDISGTKSPSNIYTEEQVHIVCKLLEQGKNAREISEIVGVSPNLPSRIKYLGKWKTISSLYNIPKPLAFSHNTTLEMEKLFDEGVDDYTSIICRLSLPDTKRTKSYYYGVKYRYKRKQSQTSTTIEN